MVQTFSPRFHDCYVSGWAVFLYADAAFRFKVVADDELLCLCDAEMVYIDFVWWYELIIEGLAMKAELPVSALAASMVRRLWSLVIHRESARQTGSARIFYQAETTQGECA